MTFSIKNNSKSDNFFNKNNSKTTTSCNVKDNCDFVNKDITIPNSTPCNKSSPNDTSSPCVFRHNSSSESSPSVSISTGRQ